MEFIFVLLEGKNQCSRCFHIVPSCKIVVVSVKRRSPLYSSSKKYYQSHTHCDSLTCPIIISVEIIVAKCQRRGQFPSFCSHSSQNQMEQLVGRGPSFLGWKASQFFFRWKMSWKPRFYTGKAVNRLTPLVVLFEWPEPVFARLLLRTSKINNIDSEVGLQLMKHLCGNKLMTASEVNSFVSE